MSVIQEVSDTAAISSAPAYLDYLGVALRPDTPSKGSLLFLCMRGNSYSIIAFVVSSHMPYTTSDNVITAVTSFGQRSKEVKSSRCHALHTTCKNACVGVDNCIDSRKVALGARSNVIHLRTIMQHSVQQIRNDFTRVQRTLNK